MRYAFAALLCAAALPPTGCASTQVTVHKVDPATPAAAVGIRYSLPKPFLLVTPDPSGDGTVKTEVVYFPDETQTYAIDAATKRGKYSLDVTIKDGLLGKVAWSRSDAALAAEAAKAIGDAAKAAADQVKTDRDAREAKAKEEQKAAKEEIKTLEDALDGKKLDVELAEEEVRSAQTAAETAQGDAARTAAQSTLRAAQLKLAQEKLRRDAAQRALDAAKARNASILGPLNEPAGKKTQKTFWGPVLYAINDTVTGGKHQVTLTAVKWDNNLKQPTFDTSSAPKPEPPAAAAPTLDVQGVLAFTWPAGSATHTIDVALTGAIVSIKTDQRRLFKRATQTFVDPPPVNLVLGADKKSIAVTFTQKLDAGEYDLTVPFIWGDQKDGSVTPVVRVQ